MFYILITNIVVLILYSIFFYRALRKEKFMNVVQKSLPHLKVRKFHVDKFKCLSILAFLTINFVMIAKIIDFTLIKPEIIGIKGPVQEVRVMFFNKLFHTPNWDDIDKKIQEINPDIIGIAEIVKEDYDILPTLPNLSKYPYKKINQIGDTGIFSKYEILDPNITSTLNETEARYASVATINFKGSNIKVVSAHPYPPITANYYDEEALVVSSILQENPDILMGDFNRTPWSPIFTKLTGNDLKDTSKGQGLNTTWNGMPLLYLHLDHIFVKKYAAVKEFHIDDSFGSDHHMIWSILEI
jgi:endonuclease/exonuclease/phosphatase (EEP) superfamily protein YafD